MPLHLKRCLVRRRKDNFLQNRKNIEIYALDQERIDAIDLEAKKELLKVAEAELEAKRESLGLAKPEPEIVNEPKKRKRTPKEKQ